MLNNSYIKETAYMTCRMLNSRTDKMAGAFDCFMMRLYNTRCS